MSEDMKQPKFKFGTLVKDYDDHKFKIRNIKNIDGKFYYAGDCAWGEPDKGWSSESDLTEVKEPLRAEFECEWMTVAPGMVTPVSFDRSYIVSAILKKFKGKRTKVILEELP